MTVFCLVGAALLPCALHASIVLSENTALTPSGSLPVFTDYASFSTGAQAGTLSNVVVVLSRDNTSSGTIDVGLYSNDIGDVPGALATGIGTIQDTGRRNAVLDRPDLVHNLGDLVLQHRFQRRRVANEFYSQSAGLSSPNSTGPLLMEVEMTPSAVPEPAAFAGTKVKTSDQVGCPRLRARSTP